jgi:dTDP-4-dehydrorhamnose 3,5-epimerase
MNPVEKIVNSSLIEGSCKIILDIHKDNRGEIWTTYEEDYCDYSFVSDKVTISTKGVLRGFHGDADTAKLITCLSGKIQLALLDLRKNSKTYGNVEVHIIDEENPALVLVPPGVVNAHLCLSDRCVFHYKWSKKYAGPDKQITISWDDPDVNVDWLIKKPILSKRDKEGQSFVGSYLMEKTLEEVALNQKKELDKGTVAKLRDGDEEFFELKAVDYSFGQRLVYAKKSQKDYETLQGARGGAVLLDGSKQEVLLQKAKEEIKKVLKKDMIRIKELDYIAENYHPDLFQENHKIAELGFRIPKLLNYYQEKGFKAKGFDVLDVNIMTGKLLGYEVLKYDFDDCREKLILDDSGLVISYHMLEHLTDPLKAIKKIYDSMKIGSYFHVEVPVEGGFPNIDPRTMKPWINPDMTKRKYNTNVPNIRYGHLFAFHQGDLGKMLNMAGFNIISMNNDSHDPAGHIERYFAKKDKLLGSEK